MLATLLRTAKTSEQVTCTETTPVTTTLTLLFQLHVKVKQSLYRPGETLRFPGGYGSQISRQSAHKGGKVVSPTHRLPLPPKETFLVPISVA